LEIILTGPFEPGKAYITDYVSEGRLASATAQQNCWLKAVTMQFTVNTVANYLGLKKKFRNYC